MHRVKPINTHSRSSGRRRVMRSEILEENRERLLSISDVQAVALLKAGAALASASNRSDEDEESAEKRSAIDCHPHTSGLWRVAVRNAVGLISIGELQIVVQPKIPADHLLFLLSRSGQLPKLSAERAQAARSA